ncbi:hypothetical protein [Saccharospirillum mangrovi]|nr:hypothetical protein [Saccharospirillum mangrovi]
MTVLLLVVSLIAAAVLTSASSSSQKLEPIRLPVEEQRHPRRPRR